MRHVVLIGMVFVFCGCQAPVQVAVWKPPSVYRAIGNEIALGEIAGTRETAKQLRQALLESTRASPTTAASDGIAIAARPLDPAPWLGDIRWVDPLKSADGPAIARVSFEDQPNDLAISAAFRDREDAPLVLRGEILNASFAETNDPEQPLPPLRVSWRLLSIQPPRSLGGGVVRVDADTIAKNLPSLRETVRAEQERLATLAKNKARTERGKAKQTGPVGRKIVSKIAPETWREYQIRAAVIETLRLLAPHVETTSVRLAKPRGMPGDRGVRRGVEMAQAGDWWGASRVWEQVSDRHRRNHAAMHNLAIAKVAAQDYEAARTWIDRAGRIRDSKRNRHTAVWIESLHRDAVDALALPEPAVGWNLTRPGHN